MPWIGGALSLGGALIGAFGANEASGQQSDAASYAAQLAKQQYDTTRGDLMPWQEQGKYSLKQLGDMTRDPNSQLLKPFGMEDFKASPAYNFNLQEGEKAINKASAARGKYYAPGTLQEISKYSQGLASNEFQNAYSNYNTNMGNVWNRLYSMSGSGQNAANQTGGFGANAANSIGQNVIGGANASAAGTIGGANALAGGANSAYNNYLTSQLLSQNQRSSVPMVGAQAPGQYDVFNSQYG